MAAVGVEKDPRQSERAGEHRGQQGRVGQDPDRVGEAERGRERKRGNGVKAGFG